MTDESTNQEPTIDVDAQQVFLMDGCVKTIVNGAEKFISLEDFVSILERGLSSQRATQTEQLFLPRGVTYMGRTASSISLNCYHPGGIRNIKYHDNNRPSVIPNIIVSHRLSCAGHDMTVESTRYFCTDLPASRLPRRLINSVNPEERIYLLPFTNTYAEGNMCYGSNSMPRVFHEGNLRGLDWYYDYMFESPFNDDLGITALARSESPSSWYSQLARLAQTNEPFPYEKLRGYRPL